MTQLRLLPYIFPCISENQLVFLDARKGNYLSLSQEQTQLALSLLEPATSAHCHPASSEQAGELYGTLLSNGVATACSKQGKPLEFLELPKPSAEILGTGYFTPPTIKAEDICHYLSAILHSFIVRNFIPFRYIHAIQRRRKIKEFACKDADPTAALNQLIDKFFYMSTFVYRTHNRCFFNSLALMRFLGSYGHKATWVFGVTLAPFSAHCWTQVDHMVIGEAFSAIEPFQPILAI